MLRGFKHLVRHVLEEFHFGRQVASFQIAGVVHQHVRIAGLLPDPGEGVRYGISRNQVQLHDGAVAALLSNRGVQRFGVGGAAGGKHREEPFLGKLLRDSAAHAPAHANGQVAVVNVAAVNQVGIASVGLPF